MEGFITDAGKKPSFDNEDAVFCFWFIFRFARRLSLELNGRLPIIGVGGIDSVIAAREKIAAGASLVQIYSGFIFKGPPLIKEIVTHI